MSSDHLRNARQSLSQRTQNAARSASAGRLGDAVESAVEGITEAATEATQSVVKNTSNLLPREQRNE